MLQKYVKICKTIHYLTENKLKKRKTPLLYHIAHQATCTAAQRTSFAPESSLLDHNLVLAAC